MRPPTPQFDLARSVLMALALALSFGGCSCSCNPDDDAPDDAGAWVPDPGPCGRARVLCDGLCIDPMTDSAYCGAYNSCLGPYSGELCAIGELCVDGGCRPPCEPSQVRCDGACIDPLTDREHCGAALDCELDPGSACPDDAACEDGRCETTDDCQEDGGCDTCPAGLLACESGCIDPDTHRDHCGAADSCLGDDRGQPCGEDEHCADGACTRDCPPGFIVCDGLCTDPQQDPRHCGAGGACMGDDAGDVCLDGQACAAGRCLWRCPVGLLACDGGCIDPHTDANHCGASGDCTGPELGQACTADEACEEGACVPRCDPGELVCDGACVDPDSDPQHCGATWQCMGMDAGEVCQPPQVCDQGACESSCSPPLSPCDGGCVDLGTDRDHCSGCGLACEPGESCSGGVCELGCPDGQVSCDDRCIDPLTDPLFCGAQSPCSGGGRGESCEVGQACVDGGCQAACPTGFLRCDGGCREVASDPAHCGACGAACDGAETCTLGECLCASPPDCACVVHVNQRTGHDDNAGDSWSFPLATVGAGIERGRARGCAIWVAEGRYVPTAGDSRNASFALQHGVFLFGGFDGGETRFDERDVAVNETILSGDIGVQGQTDDNSVHVVTCLHEAGCDATAVLDGFTVRDGHADGGLEGGEGAGLRITGPGPTVAGCRFEYNRAFRGGAVSVTGGSATIRDSVFEDNDADAGGAVHASAAQLTIEGSHFQGHQSSGDGGTLHAQDNSTLRVSTTQVLDSVSGGAGGAIRNVDGETELTDCELVANAADGRGGAVSAGGRGRYVRTRFADNLAAGFAAGLDARGETTIIDCTFERNVCTDDAGAIYAQPDSVISIVGSTLRGNRSIGYGGGLYAALSEVQLADNLFDDNESTISGGGAQISRSHLIASGNRFIDNRTVYNGGGLHSSDPASEAEIADSYFRGNFSDRGGGLKLSQGWAHVHRCLFEANTADHGAGLATFQLEATIHDNVFHGNVAVTYGGGMSGYYNSVLDVTNNTFVDNVLTGPGEIGGAGLHSFVSTQMRVRNCILWGNRAPIGTLWEQQVFTPEVRAEVTYSNVEDGCAAPACTTDDTGNIASSPDFVDAAAGDFRLQSTSQCVDTGLDAAVDWPERVDHGGLPRITDGPDPGGSPRVDMGAHEWQP